MDYVISIDLFASRCINPNDSIGSSVCINSIHADLVNKRTNRGCRKSDRNPIK